MNSSVVFAVLERQETVCPVEHRPASGRVVQHGLDDASGCCRDGRAGVLRVRQRDQGHRQRPAASAGQGHARATGRISDVQPAKVEHGCRSSCPHTGAVKTVVKAQVTSSRSARNAARRQAAVRLALPAPAMPLEPLPAADTSRHPGSGPGHQSEPVAAARAGEFRQPQARASPSRNSVWSVPLEGAGDATSRPDEGGRLHQPACPFRAVPAGGPLVDA